MYLSRSLLFHTHSETKLLHEYTHHSYADNILVSIHIYLSSRQTRLRIHLLRCVCVCMRACVRVCVCLYVYRFLFILQRWTHDSSMLNPWMHIILIVCRIALRVFRMLDNNTYTCMHTRPQHLCGTTKGG